MAGEIAIMIPLNNPRPRNNIAMAKPAHRIKGNPIYTNCIFRSSDLLRPPIV